MRPIYQEMGLLPVRQIDPIVDEVEPAISVPLERKALMNWYHYIACFFAGIFLANVVPHFVHGISGDRFPTPFAKPPGRGLSSPTVNVLWALLNLAVGYFLFHVGKISSENISALIVFFVGIAAISILSSVNFAKKHSS